MQEILNALERSDYTYAIAIATQAEIDAGAACGQLASVTE